VAWLVGAAVADAELDVVEVRDVVVVRRKLVWFDGISAVVSARTTSLPGSSPSVICTHPPPTAPVFTLTVVAVVALALSTTWTVAAPVPVGVTAEAGTRTALAADFTGISTDAFAPEASSPAASLTDTSVA
jgi:hypothetical protein